MKHRSKLDIGSKPIKQKKQASGFGGQSETAQEEVAFGASFQRAQESPASQGDPVPQSRFPAALLNNKRILKAVLVVAVAGVSIYLLKRRLR